MIRTEAASAAHAAGLAALFEAAGSPCYCRYWHFEGTSNAWLERCATAPGDNRAELEAALAAMGAPLGAPLVGGPSSAPKPPAEGRDEARGVVALDDAGLVGWLKVAPAAVMAKAYGRRLYRGLPCFGGDREGVFLVGCALVHPAHRRRGVATALVAGAVRLAPAWGARALEALPRRPREAVSDEELWTGPLGAFAAAGFVEVSASAVGLDGAASGPKPRPPAEALPGGGDAPQTLPQAYPVLRREL